MRTLIAMALLAFTLFTPHTASAQTIQPNALCPDSWTSLNSYPGVVLGCYCPGGQIGGTVWGTNPYTSDSSICGAARHSGAIPATGGAVWSMISQGLDSYSASTSNGISTRDYGSYSSSAIILNATAPTSVQYASCPSNMRGESGSLDCKCEPAAMTGSVWGTTVYTDDSSVCHAALHAGMINANGGIVTVNKLGGQNSYTGSSQNGVTSSDYGSWGGSFDFTWRP